MAKSISFHPGELAKFLCRLSGVSIARVFGRGKVADGHPLTVQLNARLPSNSVLGNTFELSATVSAKTLVHGVLTNGCQPQIIPTIVRSVPVLMVDEGRWPRTGHVEPSNSAGSIFFSKYCNVAIALLVDASCARANFRSHSKIYGPNKNAVDRIVGNDPAQLRGSKRFLCDRHVAGRPSVSADRRSRARRALQRAAGSPFLQPSRPRFKACVA